MSTVSVAGEGSADVWDTIVIRIRAEKVEEVEK
jgi:hypothetical protein